MKDTIKIISIIFLLFNSILQAQSLDEYIRMAWQHAPEMKAANYRILQAEANEISAHALTDTKISTGIYLLQPETRVGNQQFALGALQEFPWPGTLKAKKKWLAHQTLMQSYDTTLVKRQLKLYVSTLYYELFEKNQTVLILKENKKILQSYEDMALASLENNRANINDVLRIRIQKNQLHARIYKTLNELKALQEEFNRLLGRPVDAHVELPAKLRVENLNIPEQSLENHPALEQIKEKSKQYELKQNYLRKQNKPKITLGVNYINVFQRNDMVVINNGKDILAVQIGLKIPLFNTHYKAQIKKTEWKTKETEMLYAYRLREFENELSNVLKLYENELINVMTAQKNTEEAQRMINISLKSYETGMLDYENILDFQLQKLKYQLMEIQAVKNAFSAKAKAEYLIGN